MPTQSSIEWIFNGKMAIVTLFSLPEVFCGPQICKKCVGDGGSAPNAAEGTHDAPPEPLVGWGGGHPISNSHPLGAFGASIPAPTALSFCAPNVKSWLHPCPPA